MLEFSSVLRSAFFRVNHLTGIMEVISLLDIMSYHESSSGSGLLYRRAKHFLAFLLYVQLKTKIIFCLCGLLLEYGLVLKLFTIKYLFMKPTHVTYRNQNYI